MPRKHHIRPEARGFAAGIDVLENAGGAAMFRVGGKRGMMRGQDHRSFLFVVIGLEACQVQLEKIELIVNHGEMAALG